MSLYLEDVYFNGLIQGRGLLTRSPVRVATTANITLSGTQTIDGVAVVANDRVLVKDQTTGSQNGIYNVASGSWTRSQDFDTGDVASGLTIQVLQGSANGGIKYYCNTSPAIIGTNSLTFKQVLNTTSTQNMTNALFSDALTHLVNGSDQTKRIRFDDGALSASQTVNLSLPDISGELVTANSAQNFSSGTKTCTDNVTFISDNLDGTKKAAFELSGITTGTQRVLTVPNESGTLVTLDGVQTLTNKTLQGIKTEYIKDVTYGNTILRLTNTSSNDDVYLRFTNGGTSGPEISGQGSVDCGIDLVAKGSGAVRFRSTTSDAATRYYNSLGNYFELKAPASMSENVTMQLPTLLPTTAKQMLKVQGSTGQLEFSLDRLTFTLSNTTNIVTTTPKLLVTTCFPWIQSYYGAGGSLEIEDGYLTYMYKATAPAFGRVLTVEVMDAFSNVVLGTSAVTIASVTETAVRFQFTLPTANASLQMRISADGSGGNINIYGGTLDLGKR
jgi:hypothetical protein